MAELFQTTKKNISFHIQNIFEESELTLGTTVKKFLTVRQEGTLGIDITRQPETFPQHKNLPRKRRAIQRVTP